ncbi:MAG: hypothetical protein CMN98_03110 [Synechococcus sp. NP17]|nr:hypothetical protein [Synechococcus sp. NP17]
MAGVTCCSGFKFSFTTVFDFFNSFSDKETFGSAESFSTDTEVFGWSDLVLDGDDFTAALPVFTESEAFAVGNSFFTAVAALGEDVGLPGLVK